MSLRRLGPWAASVLATFAWFATAQESIPDLPGEVWTLEVPKPVAQKTTAVNPRWKELDCARCHEAIAAEWSATRHAQAWNNEVYQEELATIRKPSKCTSCHAPEPLLVAGLDERVTVREDEASAHFGVDCNACHLGADGSIQGPWGAANDAHTSTRNEIFTLAGSNELCLACHSRSVGPVIGIGRDFEDAELADRGFSCVGCHMAPVKRPIASGEGLAARPGRSHHLQTPRDPGFLRQAFRIDVEGRPGIATLRLANRAGHRIPGLNDRVLLFRLVLLDRAGAAIASQDLEISRSEPLGVAETLTLELTSEGATHLRVQGLHEAKSLDGRVEFYSETFELGE